MEANKIWGFILISVGVLLIFGGIAHLFWAFSVSAQVNAMSGWGGGAARELASSMAPSKIPGFIVMALGGASAFFGAKLFTKAKPSK